MLLGSPTALRCGAVCRRWRCRVFPWGARTRRGARPTGDSWASLVLLQLELWFARAGGGGCVRTRPGASPTGNSWAHPALLVTWLCGVSACPHSCGVACQAPWCPSIPLGRPYSSWGPAHIGIPGRPWYSSGLVPWSVWGRGGGGVGAADLGLPDACHAIRAVERFR